MQHKEYWAERFEKLTDAQLNKGTEYYYNLQEQYRQAIANIEKDIAKWYTRYATENGITLTEAKRLLNGRELEEFRMDVKEYIAKGKSLDPKWAKQLEAASTKVHVSRLEALKVQMQQQAEMLYSYERDGIDELARNIYTDGYYHTAYEIQKGVGVGFDLMQLDANRIDKLIAKPWAADGKNFSERIWNNRAQLVSELENRLTQSIIRGQSPKKVIAEIAERFNVNKSRAGALVMTESAFFAAASQKDAFTDLDVEKYEILATLDSRTSETCRHMDGKVIPMKDYKPGVTAPPFHVRCRSTTVPFFDDEFTIGEQRAARGEDGKYYTVPANMKYKDWEEAFVKGGSKNNFVPALDNVVSFDQMNNTQLDEWAKSYYGKNNISLTAEELKALDDYGEGGYGLYNGIERFKEGSAEYEKLVNSYGQEWIEKTQAQTKQLSKALSKFNLDENIMVHRAVRDIAYITGEETNLTALEKMIGKTFTEKGYVSTSLQYQSKFMGTSKNGVHMEILVPKGSNGAYIDKFVAKNEREFLLNKGQRFKVIDAGERTVTVKKTKFDFKERKWIETTEEVKERFMKVQLISEKLQTKVTKGAKINSIKDISGFEDLAEFMRNNYGVKIDDAVKNLNFKVIKQALRGIEKLGKEVPEVLDNLKELITSNTGIMSCAKNKITFNPTYFKDRKLLTETCLEYSKTGWFHKNSSIESLGVHEAAHSVEWVLVDKNPAYSFDFEKILAWNDCTEAKKIVSQACKNIKKTPFGKGKRNAELIETVSRYAKKNESETLAEAFADIAANGKNASPLSVEIKRLTLEQYRKYKGVT